MKCRRVGMYGGEPRIARPRRVAPLGLEMIEKLEYQGNIEMLEV